MAEFRSLSRTRLWHAIIIRYHQRLLGMLVFEIFGNIALLYCSFNLIVKTSSQIFINPTSGLAEKTTGQTFASPSIHLTLMILVVALPAIRGVLFGATLFTMEFEAKTFKFVFTQSIYYKKVVSNYIIIFMFYVFLSSLINAYIIHEIFIKWRKIEVVSSWSVAGILMHSIGSISFSLTVFAFALLSGGLARKLIPSMSLSLIFIVGVVFLISAASKIQLDIIAGGNLIGVDKANFIEGYKAGNHEREFSSFLIHFMFIALIFIFVLVFLIRMFAAPERPNPIESHRSKAKSSQYIASQKEVS